MHDITQETTQALVAEADRSGLPVPASLRVDVPAGFTLVEDPSGDTNVPEFAEGPKVNAGNIEVTADWYEPDGICFSVRNTNGSDPLLWTRQELETLPTVISEVLNHIDTAAALAVLREHPDLIDPTSTVTKLCEFAMEQNMSASAMFAAYQQLTEGGEANDQS